MWDRVADAFNSRNDKYAPFRDVDSIKNKWKMLKGMKKPTGDPTCPEYVKRAKRLSREIETSVSAFQLGNDGFESKSSASYANELSSRSSSCQYSMSSSPIQNRDAFIVEETCAQSSPNHHELQDAQLVSVTSSQPDEGAAQGENAVVTDSLLVPDVPVSLLNSLSDLSQKKLPRGRKPKPSMYVPSRLGQTQDELQDLCHTVLVDKNRYRDKDRSKMSKSSIPENPTHTKKAKLAQQLKEIDAEHEDRVHVASTSTVSTSTSTVPLYWDNLLPASRTVACCE
jgi:hypothetical protein